MKSNKVTFLKSGNFVVVNPTTAEVEDILRPVLTFKSQRSLHGVDWLVETRLAEQEERAARRMQFEEHEQFDYDHRKRIAFPFGLYRKAITALKQRGYVVLMQDLSPPDPKKFTVYWERLKEFKLRWSQDETILKILSEPCGIIDCPPGYGKSFIIGVVAKLLPYARIDVVTDSTSVALSRLYPALVTLLPDVGIVGGGKRKKGARVMVYTVDSYHHAEGDADILFGDEVHELCSDSASGKLGKALNSRNYGFSASVNMRLDQKDPRAEAIFGPVIQKIHYEEAVQNNLVVPIEVRWGSVCMDFDPCEGLSDVDKKRNGIWCNDYRNDLIAKDAKNIPDSEQRLIVCETIEHAVNLKARLPDYELVYRQGGLSAVDRAHYIRAGLITSNEPEMTLERRMKLTQQFEQGKLLKVIANKVWNVGVSFDYLSELIRADAGGAPIADTQIPGRLSRLSENKVRGILRDYKDEFNKGFRSKARGRRRTYEGYGWIQIDPKKAKKGTLRAQMEFEWEQED